MKPLGYLIFANVIVVCGYVLFATNVDWKRVTTFGGLGIVISICLIWGDQITRWKVLGWEIEKARDRAITGAQAVESIQRDVQAQKESIEMIVQNANDARREIDRVGGLADRAKASSERLQRLSDFNLLLVRMENDDRLAFDEIRRAAKDAEEPFRELAKKALDKQVYTSVLGAGPGEVDLRKLNPPLDPDTATIGEFREVMGRTYPMLASVAMNAVWRRQRFLKRDRVEFVVEQIEKSKSLQVLTDACRILSQETNMNFSILEWERCLDWWKENKARYAP